ncbi:hypothetical protein [Thiomicrorhabdus sp.]|uniref:hypothetical protein n=1 Tax=Thiomicrorhabdus sp. TaxID=2039724 RepID=UPI0029C71B6E|nr:hypothetical protein [Thiomicrorhabdus sp.]
MFLLQTLATSAWGAMSAPAYSASEMIEMQIMHKVMHMDVSAMTQKSSKPMASMPSCDNSSSKVSCDQCDFQSCHNLLCASIHVAPLFSLAVIPQLNLQQPKTGQFTSFSASFTTISVQPELPPPNSSSI